MENTFVTVTSKKKRCMYCKGRLITDIYKDGTKKVNLDFGNGFYWCKDKRECQQNLECENTFIEYSEDEQGNITTTLLKDGEVQIEVVRGNNGK